jgi:transcription-repair coupling factor (superfamily II helicase)
VDRYGVLPEPVQNLFAVAEFRVKARAAGLTEVSLQGRNVRFAPLQLADSKVMRLQRLYPGAAYKQTVRTVVVPQPTTARIGGRPLRDRELLDWASGLIDALTPEAVAV